MIDPKLQEAQNVVAEYKAHNINTVERSVQIGPKTWVMKKVTIDENAAKLASKLKPKPEVKKTMKVAVKQNNTPSHAKAARSRIMARPKGNRLNVYDDYVLGLSIAEISKKYGVGKKTVSSYVSKQKQDLGLSRNLKGVTYRKACKFFAETDKNNTEISKILNISAHTVCYHRKRYKREKETS